MEFINGLNKEETIEVLQKYIDINSHSYICCFITENTINKSNFTYATIFIEHWYGYLKWCDGNKMNSYSTGIFGRATLSNQIKRVNFIKTIINNLKA